jgi:maltose alpha-D-glucosyltransferase/alpha-amylase
MRKRFKAFGRGDIQFLSPSNSKILAFTRTYEDEIILVIANLSRFSQAAELDLSAYKGFTPVEVFSQSKFPNIKEDLYLFTMGPNAYHWFIVKNENVQSAQAADTEKPILNLNTWESLFETANQQQLESKVLIGYVKTCRWFGGKARTIQRIKILDNIEVPFGKDKAALLIAEVSYTEGLPELYQLPIAFAAGDLEKKLRDNCPKGVIATIAVKVQKEYYTMLYIMMSSSRLYL